MSVIVDIDLATDLSEFTSTTTDSGDLSQAAGAGLAGTSGGLSCVIDDTTAIFGQHDLASPYSTTGILRARYYVDPNSLTMANNNSFVMFRCDSSAGVLIYCHLRYVTGEGYYIYGTTYNDVPTPTNTAYYAITDGEHYVEVKLIRATNNASSDGSFQLWIDGADKETISNIDNYDRFAAFKTSYLGPVVGLDAGTSGTFYMDELVINDDGGAIGPVAAAGDPEGSLIGGKLLRGGLLTHGVLVRG
jgi:hypothetical protein